MQSESITLPSAQLVARLTFGEGTIGKDASFDEAELAETLPQYVKPLTVFNTAFCGDGRGILSIGGNTDPSYIERIVAEQQFGGLILPIAKAATAADLAIVRDAKNFVDAYLSIENLVSGIGYKDSAHPSCAASGGVEDSVAKEVPIDEQIETVGKVRPLPHDATKAAEANQKTKKRKLESGFFGTWSNDFHLDYVSNKYPENVVIYETDNSENKGHHEVSQLYIAKPGFGFAKNPFIQDTGLQTFCETTYTPSNLIEQIATIITIGPEEKTRFLFEAYANAPHVLNCLVSPGFDIFRQS